jgi:hypothetical protein
MEYKQTGIKKVRISSPGGCRTCIDLMGKVLTIEDALERMPLPSKECAHGNKDGKPGWCRCGYVPFFDDPRLDSPDSDFEEQKQKARERL